MPRLVLPRCVVDTRVARGLRCTPPTTASTQFVHSCRWEIDQDGRCGERRDGTDAHRPKAAEIIQGGTVQGWDRLPVAHRPLLALSGIFSVVFASSVEVRAASR